MKKLIIIIQFVFSLCFFSTTSAAFCSKVKLKNDSFHFYHNFTKSARCFTFKVPKENGQLKITSTYPLYIKIYYGRAKLSTSKKYLTNVMFKMRYGGWYYLYFFSNKNIAVDVSVKALFTNGNSFIKKKTTPVQKNKEHELAKRARLETRKLLSSRKNKKTAISHRASMSVKSKVNASVLKGKRKYNLFLYSVCSRRKEKLTFFSRGNFILLKRAKITYSKTLFEFIFTKCQKEGIRFFQVFARQGKHFFKFRKQNKLYSYLVGEKEVAIIEKMNFKYIYFDFGDNQRFFIWKKNLLGRNMTLNLFFSKSISDSSKFNNKVKIDKTSSGKISRPHFFTHERSNRGINPLFSLLVFISIFASFATWWALLRIMNY